MRLQSLLSAIGLPVPEGHETDDIRTLTADSRRACEHALFVCVKGMSSNGHTYAKSAYELGCRHFVAMDALALPGDACVLLCEDTREALSALARCFYGNPERELLLIGVTGTKGKTTAALMAHHMLCENGIETGYIGSNGAHYAGIHEETANTTPESIELARLLRRMRDKDVRAVVMEVSSQALYMHRVRGLAFPVAAFTNLAPDHIGGVEHPTFEHYRDCKARLFSDYGCETMILCADDAHAPFMRERSTARAVLSYAKNDRSADYLIEDETQTASKGRLCTAFTVRAKGERLSALLPIPGNFNVANAVLALALAEAAADYLSVSVSRAKLLAAIETVSIAGRFEAVPLTQDRVFVIDYAHNGFSLTSALSVLRGYAPARLICLVGSVGGRTEMRRGELGRAASDADLVIITSDNPDKEDPMTIMQAIADECTAKKVQIADREEAIAYAVRISHPGDIILLAGKGHERYQLINGKKLPFCEKEILTNAWSEITLEKERAKL